MISLIFFQFLQILLIFINFKISFKIKTLLCTCRNPSECISHSLSLEKNDEQK